MMDNDHKLESPESFNTRVGLNFTNRALLIRALTHRSYINEDPLALEDNERLEFLGDAVLDFIVAAWLYHHFPEMSEGDLTQLRTALVRTDQLAQFARKIRLGQALRLGQGENMSGGRNRNALLCGSFEAVIGSYYLDQGIEAVETFLEPFLEEAVQEIMRDGHPRDPKSLLQEWAQARGWPSPEYRTVLETGPDHQKEFIIEVSIGKNITAEGKGHSKQEASKTAARTALKNLTTNE